MGQSEKGYQAGQVKQIRVAALWLVHANSLGDMLRAYGRAGHAEHLDAALEEVSKIVAGEIGQEAWTDAMDWASNELWRKSDAARSATHNGPN